MLVKVSMIYLSLGLIYGGSIIGRHWAKDNSELSVRALLLVVFFFPVFVLMEFGINMALIFAKRRKRNKVTK